MTFPLHEVNYVGFHSVSDKQFRIHWRPMEMMNQSKMTTKYIYKIEKDVQQQF